MAEAGQLKLAARQAPSAFGPVTALRIGIITDMSGQYADGNGPGSVIAAQMAVEEIGGKVAGRKIEIISAEQMLDAYCSIGMPLMYGHWSFGKKFVHHEKLYRYGYQALAYEIVINSNPCISYYMEENTMAMQTLVLAHAAFGHNHFYKNNYLFKQWTDADGILDYLEFAKGYIAQCEEKYGENAVERLIDAAH